MQSTVEALTENFYDWELSGRGWRTYAYPVPLEPPFRPFSGHGFPSQLVDDGRKHTLLSSLLDRLAGRATPDPPTPRASEDDDSPPLEVRDHLFDFEVFVPEDTKIDPATSEAWLRSVSATSGRLAFELVGSGHRVHLRLAVEEGEQSLVRDQLHSCFPSVAVREAPRLTDVWVRSNTRPGTALEFGLGHEFMLPLNVFKANPDPLTPIVGALARAATSELAIVQVLLQPARAPWASSVVRAVTAPDGSAFFVDAPHITDLARDKCSAPLYAVVLRAAACSEDDHRVWDLLRGLAGAVAQYGSPDRNELVPLAAENPDELFQDVLCRWTRRSGMILSLPELSSIVRLPGEHVRVAALVRQAEAEGRLPQEVLGDRGAVFGESLHKGVMTPIRLSPEARLQHTYVIGGTGTGKSTLLQHLILQDIAAGEGVGVVDPHGDLIDEVLARIPEDRLDDLVLFDPADPDSVVGWNILGAYSDAEKDLLSSDLVAVFRRLSSSWGDQMNAVLANAVLAFLESDRGGTLADLRRFLLDDTYRLAFLGTVKDEHVASFWQEEFPLIQSKRPQAPILTRLDNLLRSRLVRDAVTEASHPLNFRQLIDRGAILLAKLSQGAIGEENAALLGSLLVSKIHQVSLSRQDTASESRRPFHLYIDEFHHFATPSMASLFSGVRKYRLGLTVAHQNLYQLHATAPEVERAILANAFTRVLFRPSDEDARKFEKGLEGFTAEDLANLGRGSAVCRVGQRTNAFRLKTSPLPEIASADRVARQDAARAASAARHGTPRPRRNTTNADGKSKRAPSAPPLPKSSREGPEAPTEEFLVPENLPGRGGAIHKYVQGLIREWAKAQGFRADIEFTLPDGKRVDVALSRGELRIACEIAGTSNLDHELSNIDKCLAGPFSHVVAVSLDRSFLGRLAESLGARLAKDQHSRVSTLSPEEFLAFLQAQGREKSASRVAGYAVKVKHRAGTPDAEARRRAVAEVMLKSVKRIRGESSA